MVSSENAHHAINLGLHVWILFTFLTIFFFTFISRKESESITNELNNAIDNYVPTILDSIDKIDKKIGYVTDWKKVNDIAKKIETKNNINIKDHNKKLIKTSIIISIIILLVLICVIIYFKFYKKYDIGLKIILYENLAIFTCIGIIELMFFLNVALKYSPVTESDMVTQVVDRVEYKINEQLAPK